jgi:hypothetical protein
MDGPELMQGVQQVEGLDEYSDSWARAIVAEDEAPGTSPW